MSLPVLVLAPRGPFNSFPQAQRSARAQFVIRYSDFCMAPTPQGILEDEPYALRRGLDKTVTRLADVNACVQGGLHGCPFALGNSGLFTKRQVHEVPGRLNFLY